MNATKTPLLLSLVVSAIMILQVSCTHAPPDSNGASVSKPPATQPQATRQDNDYLIGNF